MGYKASPRTINIRFAPDHEHHGAEARVRGMTYGEWEGAANPDEDGETKKDADRLGENLVSWNLEDDHGEAIPPTREGIRAIDTSLLTALTTAWVKALTGVHDADPLPQSSPSGGPSLVESVPMEALSPSLAS
jgi:hypothetical protein